MENRVAENVLGTLGAVRSIFPLSWPNWPYVDLLVHPGNALAMNNGLFCSPRWFCCVVASSDNYKLQEAWYWRTARINDALVGRRRGSSRGIQYCQGVQHRTQNPASNIDDSEPSYLGTVSILRKGEYLSTLTHIRDIHPDCRDTQSWNVAYQSLRFFCY